MLKLRVLLLGGGCLLGILASPSFQSLRTYGAGNGWIDVVFNPTSDERRPDRIIGTGTLLWQGKPFFPIGIYHVNHTAVEYRTLAENGFNMIQGMFPGNLDTFIKSLDLALRYGIAVNVPLYVGGKVRENLENSLNTIKAAASHPAVFCWEILDEPDANRNASIRDQVPSVYRALKAAHSKQPIELTLCQDESLKFWANHCDIVQIDRYPVPSKPLTDVYDFCRNAKAAMAPWQPLIFVVQCGWTSDLKSQPTFAQARAMVYLALIGGAKGISWYSRQEKNDEDGKLLWDLMTSPLWPRLKEINSEIQSLASLVLLGEEVTGIRSSVSGVYTAGKRWQNKLYMLVSNPGKNPTDAVFMVPSDIRLQSARAIGTRGRPTLDGPNVRLLLGPTDSGTIICEIGEPSPTSPLNKERRSNK
jgi:hypothetical protein